MSPINIKQIQSLLDQFHGSGDVLSCYADLAGADGFLKFWESNLESKADAIRKAILKDGSDVKEFERNLKAVRQKLAEPRQQTARWLAVFSAQRRDFLQTVPLDTPVAPELVIDRTPYLVPLLSAAHRRREYLAVHTDTHRARIYAATPGYVEVLDDIDSDVPRKQHSSGERWGQSQATIARHRDEAILHHQKTLIHHIEDHWAQNRFTGLLLFGAHSELEHLRKAMPRRIAITVERETPESWYEQPAEVMADVEETALETFRADEDKQLQELWERLTTGRGVVTGAAEVWNAIQNGRVGPDGMGYLAFGPDPHEVVGKCSNCQTLAIDVPQQCPKCQAPCSTGNLWEELLLLALRHNVAAHFVDDPRRLEPYRGLAAVTRK